MPVTILGKLSALVARIDERVPATVAEARTLLGRLRYETGHPQPSPEAREPPRPRWRVGLERELHDEALDELLGVRRRRRARP